MAGRDIKREVFVPLHKTQSFVAGDGEDGVAKVQVLLDLNAYGSRPRAGLLRFYVTSTLTEDKTFVATPSVITGDESNLSDGAAVSTTDSTDAGTAISMTGDTGGSTETIVQFFWIDLATCKRYVGFSYTPTLSHSSTDTAAITCTAALGSFERGLDYTVLEAAETT